jgi:hypothetical protein
MRINQGQNHAPKGKTMLELGAIQESGKKGELDQRKGVEPSYCRAFKSRSSSKTISSKRTITSDRIIEFFAPNVEKRIPLTDSDPRTIVKYGMRIRYRLTDVAAIVKPDTILAWNRRMKKESGAYVGAIGDFGDFM